MRFFRPETGPRDLWANAGLIGGPPMRPAASRATRPNRQGRTGHGRPPLSFAPARRRPGAPCGRSRRLYPLHVVDAGSDRAGLGARLSREGGGRAASRPPISRRSLYCGRTAAWSLLRVRYGLVQARPALDRCALQGGIEHRCTDALIQVLKRLCELGNLIGEVGWITIRPHSV